MEQRMLYIVLDILPTVDIIMKIYDWDFICFYDVLLPFAKLLLSRIQAPKHALYRSAYDKLIMH